MMNHTSINWIISLRFYKVHKHTKITIKEQILSFSTNIFCIKDHFTHLRDILSLSSRQATRIHGKYWHFRFRGGLQAKCHLPDFLYWMETKNSIWQHSSVKSILKWRTRNRIFVWSEIYHLVHEDEDVLLYNESHVTYTMWCAI